MNAANTRTRTTSTRGAATLAPPRAAQSPSSRSKSPGRVPVRPPSPQAEPKSPLSIREAIALKRAEAKKAQASSKSLEHEHSAESTIHGQSPVDEVELSRWSIRDSIEGARSSGQ